MQVGEKEAPKELYVAMTSDRGLAGAVHSSICKAIRYKTCFYPSVSQIQVLNFVVESGFSVSLMTLRFCKVKGCDRPFEMRGEAARVGLFDPY